MEEQIVTKLWMAGIVGLMLVYAAFSIIGVSRKKQREKGSSAK